MQTHSITSTRVNILIIFLLGLFVSLIGQCHHEFIGFESRFGLFIQEMLRNGISFFPTTYSQFYPDYLATQTILSYWFSLLFGEVNIYTAILPAAIATGLSLVFTYLIGAVHSKQWGWYAVLFCLFTFAFITEARTTSLDQFTVTATVCSFYAIYNNKNNYWLLFLSWIAGFLFRGPIGLIIPAAVTSGFYFIEKDYKKLLLIIITAVLLLALCMTGLLLAAWYSGGKTFLTHVIAMQALGRMSNIAAPPIYYYLHTFLQNYAISSIIAVIVWCAYAKNLWRNSEDAAQRLLRHCAVWFLIIFIGMTIPGDKKIRYILAITPALALSAAYLFSAEHANKLLNQLRELFNKFFIILPYIGLLSVILALVISHIKHFALEIYYVPAIILFVIQIILSFRYIQKHKIIIGLAAFLTVYITIVQPILVQDNHVKRFVTQVEKLRQQQPLIFYQLGPDGDDIKYLVALDKPLQPQFAQTPEQLISFNHPAIFIADQETFAALPSNIKTNFKILLIGQLGHEKCVVFTQEKSLAFY